MVEKKVRTIFENASGYDRVSIIVPFLVISIALGVLAFRSYQLSVRMEKGMDSLAAQYLGYAAEMTARRADSVVRSTMSSAWEQWQEIERSHAQPDFSDLQRWVGKNDWIVSAIYLPDSDPVDSVYYISPTFSSNSVSHLTHEFYTANGTIRYTYDAESLLSYARRAIRQQPKIDTTAPSTGLDLASQSSIELVAPGKRTGLIASRDGLAVIVPLAPPLEQRAVRAAIRSSYIASGWENYRIVSLCVSAFAFLLLLIGVLLAIRGLTREAEAMKLRAALIANISHELRTPLSMIRLGAETLKKGTRLTDEEKHGMQDSILREVIHLNHLVENVLDVARLQKGSKPPVFTSIRPAEMIQSLLTTYRTWIESKGFVLVTEIDATIGEQHWDRDAVSRALLNLVDNAVKYSAPGQAIVVRLRKTGPEVALEVEDRGIGVPQKEITRIFEPYYRASFSDTETRRGAGLGLTLVRQIMRSHGGRIEVESAIEQGSTFRLLFPANNDPEAQVAPGILQTTKA